MNRVFLSTFAFLCCFSGVAAAADDPMVKGIEDNSFLIEEAYNQEPGVVQHIATLQRQNRDWFFGFSQEWPLSSQTHQISYSVPYLWLRRDGRSIRGLGDIEVNYRFQALTESSSTPAFAPRLGLILPSGDREKGTGEGSVGLEFLLPISKIISDRVAVHANAGLTTFFDSEGRRPTSYVLGGSAVYAVTREFNFMLELLSEWNESVNSAREIEREFTFTVSPGFRRAFNLMAGQLVAGAGVPISFTKGMTNYGVFLYLSFEHKFLK